MNPQPKPKTTRVKGKNMRQLRQECYDRAGGVCEDCGANTPWDYGHMAHIRSRGSGGEDILSNVRWKCPRCHIGIEHSPRWSTSIKIQETI